MRNPWEKISLSDYEDHMSLDTVKQLQTCIIQMNAREESWVSKSPYIHVFDSLDRIHHQVNEIELKDTMSDIGYSLIKRDISFLPKGKRLVRLDFCHRVWLFLCFLIVINCRILLSTRCGEAYHK